MQSRWCFNIMITWCLVNTSFFLSFHFFSLSLPFRNENEFLIYVIRCFCFSEHRHHCFLSSLISFYFVFHHFWSFKFKFRRLCSSCRLKLNWIYQNHKNFKENTKFTHKHYELFLRYLKIDKQQKKKNPKWELANNRCCVRHNKLSFMIRKKQKQKQKQMQKKNFDEQTNSYRFVQIVRFEKKKKPRNKGTFKSNVIQFTHFFGNVCSFSYYSVCWNEPWMDFFFLLFVFSLLFRIKYRYNYNDICVEETWKSPHYELEYEYFALLFMKQWMKIRSTNRKKKRREIKRTITNAIVN